MKRTLALVAVVAAIVVVPRGVVAAAPAPTPAAAPAAAPAPAPLVPRPAPEVGLGALQLAAGYAAEIGGLAGLLAARIYPKTFGIHSDFANVAFVLAVVPTLAGGAVCATGLLSRSYRGRCVPTFLGAFGGAILGGLIGIAAAPAPGPDDTAAFVESVMGIGGIVVFAPIGAVIGYHLGKEPIAPTAESTASRALLDLDHGRRIAMAPMRGVVLPVVDLRW